MPDEKYDVLEAQSQKISELEAKLNEEVEKNIGFKNNNAKLVREQVISQCTGDLTEVEIEKFKSLTEDVDLLTKILSEVNLTHLRKVISLRTNQLLLKQQMM